MQIIFLTLLRPKKKDNMTTSSVANIANFLGIIETGQYNSKNVAETHLTQFERKFGQTSSVLSHLQLIEHDFMCRKWASPSLF